MLLEYAAALSLRWLSQSRQTVECRCLVEGGQCDGFERLLREQLQWEAPERQCEACGPCW